MLHEYSTDPSKRVQINRAIAVCAFMAAVAINYALAERFPRSEVVGWISGPTLMAGLWVLFHSTFNHVLWKLPSLRWTLSGLRDLNGYWFGTISSERDKRLETRAAALRIRQTWSTILIDFITLADPDDPQHSALHWSSSCMAMFHSSARSGGEMLDYEFVAFRGPAGKAQGTVVAKYIDLDPPLLEGEYYAEGGPREKCRTGEVEYRRDSRQKLSHDHIRDMLRTRQNALNRRHMHARPPASGHRRASDAPNRSPDDHRPSA